MSSATESDEAAAAAVLAAARGMLESGLTRGTSGNVSARVNGDRVLITPSSLPYPEMTVADLVVVDLDGEQIGGSRAPSSEMLLHLACYRAFPEIGSVIHSHPPYATMFACAHRPVPAVIDEAVIYIGGDVPVAPYAMSGSDDLGANAVGVLGEVGSALLASHGLVTIGASPAKTLDQATIVEHCATVAWGTLALGGYVPLPAKTTEDFGAVYRFMRGG
jgi:L-fuculose-phosphate aldolase